MASRSDHRSLPAVLPSMDCHVSADAHDHGATPPGPHTAQVSNQAVARTLSTEGARPEAVIGLTGAGNRAVARVVDPAGGGGELTPQTVDQIQARRGSGAPLPDSLRSPMEQHLGTDLGAARVHTDDSADTLAGSLGAEAFTVGDDMFFSAGSYAPQTAAGRELIAHEAVHVAQQPGRVGYSGSLSDPADAAEVEARALAPAVARSVEGSPSTGAVTTAAGQAVHLARRAGSQPTMTGLLLDWSVVRERKGGKRTLELDPTWMMLQRGDRLELRMYFEGDAQSLGPPTASLNGLGQFELTDGYWRDPGTYQITLDAAEVGTAKGEVVLQLPTHQPCRLAFSADVEMDVQQFINLTSEANTKVDNAYKAVKKWFLGICIAYGTAYKRHTDALTDQAETNKLLQDLILGAALAFVAGGVGGLVATSMQRAKAGAFIVDGLNELSQFIVGSGGQAAVQQAKPVDASGLKAFPTDPLQWQNELEMRIEAESLHVGLQLEEWQHAANEDDPGFMLNFDPRVAVDRALRISGQDPASLPDVDHAETADVFEKGMWATWLAVFGYRVVTIRRQYAPLIGHDEDMAVDNAGKKIVDRCEALGLDIGPFMEIARKNAEAKADAGNRRRDES
jgi:hypothetical protein